MATELKGFTLEDLEKLSGYIPELANFPRRLLATTYQDFVDVLYEDLESIIAEMQLNPELMKDDGEDRISLELKRTLNVLGYKATHDEKIGGHSDIAVRHRRNFLWIGEAKIHSGYDYLFQGFQQLCTRYSTGDEGQDCGGLLIYIKTNNAADVIKNWRADLQGRGLQDYSDYDNATRSTFVFNSIHKHDRSGTPFNVRHIGVILGFEPKDKDVRQKKKKVADATAKPVKERKPRAPRKASAA